METFLKDANAMWFVFMIACEKQLFSLTYIPCQYVLDFVLLGFWENEPNPTFAFALNNIHLNCQDAPSSLILRLVALC